jgi:cystatin-A/B
MTGVALAGGVSGAKPADAEVTSFVNGIKDTIVEKLSEGREVPLDLKEAALEVVEYKSQVVAGINYLVKIKISDNEYAHVKIWRKVANQPAEILSVETGKSLQDQL